MDIIEIIAKELDLDIEHVRNTVALLDEGASVPFIARYRKDATGKMEDVNVRKVEERTKYLRNLEARKVTILETIESQGKLTDELRDQIEKCMVVSTLEDIYRPYKPKKLTRAKIAMNKGLGDLAKYIREDLTGDLEKEAQKYVSEEKGVKTTSEAIKGAKDIIAEEISDNSNYRSFLKRLIAKKGMLKTVLTNDDKNHTYRDYDNYVEKIQNVKVHRILATARGEKMKCLTRSIAVDEEEVINHILAFELRNKSPYESLFREIIKDSYTRLIKPSVDTDIFNEMFEVAEDKSLVTFKSSLKELLMIAPLKGQTIMGFDPGYTNGCKIAVINALGEVLDTAIVYPTISSKKRTDVKDMKIVADLIRKHHVTFIALGNGTASRESYEFLEEVLKDFPDCEQVIVSEAGASIYSASEIAIKEFPDYDVSLRSAVSIARRLLDPLSELVKIDPRSIGVGQYQHDLNQTKLKDALGGVVEDCVNAVGVDINVASPSLLSYISGINSALANEIVNYRTENGPFKSRTEFKKVKKFGPKAFENSAGFLRIKDGKEPLDNTGIHPESYKIAKEIVKKFGFTNKEEANEKLSVIDETMLANLSKELNVGEETLRDIIEEFKKPNRDPREKVVKVKLNKDVKTIKDLKVGMILEGTVRNISDFGVFVDIGIHEDGLVHISEISNSFVKNISSIVKISDIVKVVVISVDEERGRIGLSMKRVNK